MLIIFIALKLGTKFLKYCEELCTRGQCDFRQIQTQWHRYNFKFGTLYLYFTNATRCFCYHNSRRRESEGRGRVLPMSVSVCFSARYLKNRRSYDHRTWLRNVLRRVLEMRLFWGQNVEDQGYESQKHCRRGSLHSCERWLLLVWCIFSALSPCCVVIGHHEAALAGLRRAEADDPATIFALGDEVGDDEPDRICRSSARRTATRTASRKTLRSVSSSSQTMMPRMTSERNRPWPQPHSSTSADVPAHNSSAASVVVGANGVGRIKEPSLGMRGIRQEMPNDNIPSQNTLIPVYRGISWRHQL